MGSINAQRVAMKVSETIKRGQKVKLGEIIESEGYSKQTSLKPELVTNTKSYKKALEIELKPVLEQLQIQRQKILDAINAKDLSHEEYRILVGSLDIMTKNVQLLSGGATERHTLVLPSEVLARNTIATTSSDTPELPPTPEKSIPIDGSTKP